MSKTSHTEAVINWLRAGAEINAGLRLFSDISNNQHFAKMVAKNPSKYRVLLVEKLCAAIGVDPNENTPPPQEHPRPKFRDEYPFLNDTKCPDELKILASNKLTAWEAYTSAHTMLFDCTTVEDCYYTAKKLLDNYIENRLIFEEFDFYKRNKTPLGRHHIFEKLRMLREFKKLPIPDLFKLQHRLKYRVWWTRTAISQNKKPHLREKREDILRNYESQLFELEKIISTYAT